MYYDVTDTLQIAVFLLLVAFIQSWRDADSRFWYFWYRSDLRLQGSYIKMNQMSSEQKYDISKLLYKLFYKVIHVSVNNYNSSFWLAYKQIIN